MTRQEAHELRELLTGVIAALVIADEFFVGRDSHPFIECEGEGAYSPLYLRAVNEVATMQGTANALDGLLETFMDYNPDRRTGERRKADPTLADRRSFPVEPEGGPACDRCSGGDRRSLTPGENERRSDIPAHPSVGHLARVRDLVAAADADIYTDAPECQVSVTKLLDCVDAVRRDVDPQHHWD